MKPETNHFGSINKSRAAFLFLVFVLFALPLKSQQPVVLHPVVGDTIDLIEKLDYLLFSDVPDSLFEQGVLIPDNQDYQLLVWHEGEVAKVDVSAEDFEMLSGNVEKLSAYYQQKAGKKGDSAEVHSPLITRDSIPMGLNIEWMSEQQINKMTKESRRYNQLKLEADEQGLMGYDRRKYIETGGRMEFPLAK
ncbi:hypothetical protein [Marinilabilia salmonicolor]|jgi:reverse gyrase|uniref:Uncharacterized protein n=1 Tax=Marinilabilia salmonicolor TaxID=989 RepID=A0A368V4I7_9BACT|nr:hypothetical protein [Marinilabilia salmonicolor]RCW35245.1 hypothetical protein DFO77_11010 [Marinilabilia salmonicolor]